MNTTLKNYAKILEESDEYNVILKIGQEPDLKIFNAHSIILRAQSPYFHRALSKEWRKEENGKILFEKPNVSPKIFDYILKYLYSGDTSSMSFECLELTDVIVAADEFILHDLVAHIEKMLLLLCNIWLNKHFVKIYKFASQQEFCKELKEFCTKKIDEKPSIILESEDFTLLDEERMVEFLRLNDYSMKVVDVWDHVKQWGIAQNPTITFDENPKTWSQENFMRLKETLSQCLTLIKFSSITSDEFFERVKPYKQVFDPDCYEELLWNFIRNDKATTLTASKNNEPKASSWAEIAAKICEIRSLDNVASRIIGSHHISLISRWIREKTYKSCSNFNLIMDSGTDGFSSQVFSRKCDEIRSTLVILTVEGTNEILGGYNPLRWGSKGECWKDTAESFIFSFPNGRDHTNYRLSHVNSLCSKKAIYRSGTNGPNFGGGDLVMGRQYSLKRDCMCIQTNYMIPIRDVSDYFKVESFEIFEVPLL